METDYETGIFWFYLLLFLFTVFFPPMMRLQIWGWVAWILTLAGTWWAVKEDAKS